VHGLRPAHGLAGGADATPEEALEVVLGIAATALEESLAEADGVGVGEVAGPGHAARNKPPNAKAEAQHVATRDRDRMDAEGTEKQARP
jgi:hypothetical protein